MRRPRSLLSPPALFIVAAVAVVLGWCRGSKSPQNYLCNGTFALCTSAPCVPLPGSNQATCECDVLDGPSMAAVPCGQVAPTTDKNGTRIVYSMFSLEQFTQGKQAMKCAKETPWTWCLDKICSVDPARPGRAVCLCDIITTSTETWMTLGGRCDTSTCETAYWSGATLTDFAEGTRFMRDHGQDIEPKWCR